MRQARKQASVKWMDKDGITLWLLMSCRASERGPPTTNSSGAGESYGHPTELA